MYYRENKKNQTSKGSIDPQTIDQIVAAVLPKLIQEYQRMGSQQIEKLQQGIQKLNDDQFRLSSEIKEIRIILQDFKTGEEQRDLAELQRDRQMLRRVNMIQRVVKFTELRVESIFKWVKELRKHVWKIISFMLGSTVILEEIGWDIVKEVLKESVSEEIEAVAAQVRLVFKPVVEPVFGRIWEIMSPIYSSIPLKIKATIALLLIVAPIINHTVNKIVSTRRG